MLPHDLDLQKSDLQTISNRDAVVTLFTQLGYSTSARLPMTTAALGLNAEAAPTIVEPTQQTVAALLREHLNNPSLDRKQLRAALRVLSRPMVRSRIDTLKAAYQPYIGTQDLSPLLAAVLIGGSSEPSSDASVSVTPTPAINAEDLHLVCWEYVWS